MKRYTLNAIAQHLGRPYHVVFYHAKDKLRLTSQRDASTDFEHVYTHAQYEQIKDSIKQTEQEQWTRMKHRKEIK